MTGTKISQWKTIKLGALGSWVGGGTPSKSRREFWDGGHIPWISPKDMKSAIISNSQESITDQAVESSSTKLVPAGSILVVIRSGILIRKLPLAVCQKPVTVNQDLKALILDDSVNRSYVFAALTAHSTNILNECRKSGTTVCSLNFQQLKDFQIPLPPLEEQRRIAEILDLADGIRAKRREALAEVEGLTQAVFLEMFGDCRSGESDVEIHKLIKNIRNGLSPSTTGAVSGQVLTLSAITRGAFAPQFQRSAFFDKEPGKDQFVSRGDLLVCRGNGNRELVGQGVVPYEDLRDVIFPDTVIAITIDQERVVPKFLEELWSLQLVRTQIEKKARTTNGIYKVNQAVLKEIKIPLPPLPLQQKFAERVEAIETLKASHQQSLSEMDALFASLQSRAFRGEL